MLREYFKSPSYAESIPDIQYAIEHDFQGSETVLMYEKNKRNKIRAVLSSLLFYFLLSLIDVYDNVFYWISVFFAVSFMIYSIGTFGVFYLNVFFPVKRFVDETYKRFSDPNNLSDLYQDYKKFIKLHPIDEKKKERIEQNLFIENRMYFSRDKYSYHYKIASVDTLIKDLSYILDKK